MKRQPAPSVRVGYSLLLLLFAGVEARCAAAQTTTAAPAATETNLSGRVLNAVTGAAVPRALVSVGQRSVLTDPEGHFSFPRYTGNTASLRVTKPGFTESLDPDAQFTQINVADPSAPVELTIYPDAVLTGTVTAQDGTPIARTVITLLRAEYTGSSFRVVNAPNGIGFTSAEGQYRFRVPPGRYRLSLRFSPRVAESSQAVLPQSIPSTPASSDAGFFELGAGEEKVLDLHARTGTAYNVTLHSEAAEQMNGGLSVTAITPSGATFLVGAQPGPAPGDYRLRLPSGTYTLKVIRRNGPDAAEAVTRVTVAGHDVPAVPLEMTPFVSLPIEIATDSTSADSANVASTVPRNAMVLGVRLHAVADQAEGFGGDIVPTQTADGGSEFRLPSGRYQLEGFAGGGWHVVSATYGVADLLRENLVVGSGAGGAPIRLVVSSLSGQLNGTLQQEAGPDNISTRAWIYLLPQFPSLQPFFLTRAGASGNWNISLPVGRYVAVALGHSIQANLAEPAVSAGFARLGTPVEVTAAAQQTLALTLATEGQRTR